MRTCRPLHLLVSAALALLVAAPAALANNDDWPQRLKATEAFDAPAGERPTRIDRDGVTVIPNGRLINPAGTTVEVAPHPFGLELSPDGRTVATANSGIRPFSVSLIDAVRAEPAGASDPSRHQRRPRQHQRRLHGLGLRA